MLHYGIMITSLPSLPYRMKQQRAIEVPRGGGRRKQQEAIEVGDAKKVLVERDLREGEAEESSRKR